MSIFDVKKNKTICVLPWVHKHMDLKNKQRPCCQGEPIEDGRTIEDIKNEMLSGQKPIECRKCFIKEENNASSPRLIETIGWLKKFGEPDINSKKIQFLDIRNDPTCNLKCKFCGPYASTLWAKEKKLKLPTVNHSFNDYNKEDLKKVYLAGGEPTYNKSYLEFLNDLYKVNPNCEVIINSNLKRLSNEWKEVISKFKNLTVIISCDAIEDLGCYVRYPLDWKKFMENLDYVKNFANFFVFNVVLSNITTHKLDTTIKWMLGYTKNITLSYVIGEKWNYKSVPLDVRSFYIKSLSNCIDAKVSPWTAYNFRSNTSSLCENFKKNNYDPKLHQSLKQEIIEQDLHRTTQLKDVDPFLHSWIFG